MSQSVNIKEIQKFEIQIKDLIGSVKQSINSKATALMTMPAAQRDVEMTELTKATTEITKLLSWLKVYRNSISSSSDSSSHNSQQLSQLGASLDSSIQDMTSETNHLIKGIQNTHQKIQTLENELTATGGDLELKIQRQRQQESDIGNKQKLLSSRERMLQLSIEKNVYKRKVIYTYISINCLILLLVFSAYFYYNKKGLRMKNMIK
tara:strand:- start:6059 stop:6679 length:621 start_codon:yes stop_codon:yes gene_type:complete